METTLQKRIRELRSEYPQFGALDDREVSEMLLAVDYVTNYSHGTNGHISYLTIYKLYSTVLQLVAD